MVAKDDRRVPLQPGVAAYHSLEFLAGPCPWRDLIRTWLEPETLHARIDELFREDHVAGRCLHQAIHLEGIQSNRLVGHQRPGGRRPNDDGRTPAVIDAEFSIRILHRKLHVDRWRRVVGVLHLGFGQRRFIERAPEDGLFPLVDGSGCDDLAELANDGGLVVGRHREIRTIPVAQDSEPFEFVALDVDEFLRVLATPLADLDLAHPLFLRPQVLQHLMFDRQAVAVPARDVRRVAAGHGLELDDDVLEDLVQGVADVDVAIGVRRPVVQHEAVPAAAQVPDRAVDALGVPARELRGLLTRQVGLHGEVGRREIQRVAVCLGGVGHA